MHSKSHGQKNMRMRFAGTGYGVCKVKKKLSPDFRRHPTVLIDETLILDPTEDWVDFMGYYSLESEWNTVRDVLLTHSHPSHFSPQTILDIAARHPVDVYASPAVLTLLPEDPGIRPHPMTPFSALETTSGYRLIALPAPHMTENPDEVCLNFLIQRDKTVFYGVDGGLPRQEVYALLKELPPDAVVIDCALGVAAPSGAWFSHNAFDSALLLREIMTADGLLGERAKFILTHIPTDKKESIHEQLCALAAPHGMTVAYDGYFAII